MIAPTLCVVAAFTDALRQVTLGDDARGLDARGLIYLQRSTVN